MAATWFSAPHTQTFLSDFVRHLQQNYDLTPLAAQNLRIILPTQRAERALIDILLHQSPTQTVALPAITTLSDIATACLEASPYTQWQALMQTTHIVHKHQTRPQNFQTSVNYAQSLYPLLEEWSEQGCCPHSLNNLFPEHLAEHLQRNLNAFTQLLQEFPIQRTQSFNRQMAFDQILGTSHPLIICIDSHLSQQNFEFIKKCHGRPHTSLFLLGCDLKFLKNIQDDDGALKYFHPQHNFHRLIQDCGAAVQDIINFQPDASTPALSLLSHVFNNDQLIEKRYIFDDIKAISLTSSIELVECATVFEEAMTVALIIRSLLGDKETHVALITSDRTLAKLVKVHLHRWNIESDDNVGMLFFESPVGTFLKLVLECILERFSPMTLLCLFKHPFFCLGRNAATICKVVHAFENCVARHTLDHYPTTLNGWIQATDNVDVQQLLRNFEGLSRDFYQLIHSSKNISFFAVLQVHVRLASDLATDGDGHCVLFQEEIGHHALQILTEAIEAADLAPVCLTQEYVGAFVQMFHTMQLRKSYGYHPRLQILDPQQAQLIEFTHVILGSANADTWCSAHFSDTWFTQDMRAQCGLVTMDCLTSTHTQHVINLLQCGKVFITRALKVGGVQTAASSWLQRLQVGLSALDLNDMLKPSQPWTSWAQSMQEAPVLLPIQRPSVCPPLQARPQSLAVTDVEQLFQDPYAFYAKKIVKLRPRPTLKSELDSSIFGTLIHSALEDFYHHPEPSLMALSTLFQDKFQSIQVMHPELYIFYRSKFERMIHWIWQQHQLDACRIAQTLTEVKGSAQIKVGPNTFTLTATADRIDLLKDGSIRIIDYKTGMIPNLKQIQDGVRPQLILEALITRDGHFFNVPDKAVVSSVEYWQLGRHTSGGHKLVIDTQLNDCIKTTQQRLHDALALYAQLDAAYIPPWSNAFPSCPYHHLSRRSEWSTHSL